MKKKLFLSITSAFCALSCMIGLASCSEHFHDYSERVTPPTCTEQGYTKYVCDCGEEYVGDYVAATGHDYDSYVSNGDGTQTSTCGGGCGSTHTQTATGADGVSFRTLQVDGDEVSGAKYANATTSFDFAQELQVHGEGSYFVTKDKTTKVPLASSTVSLDEGANTFYVVVNDGTQNSLIYEVNLYRNHMYTVRFEDGFATQQVEEGKLVVAPSGVPTKEGYGFDGWDFDFATPITGDRDIAAIWKGNSHTVLAVGDGVTGGGAYAYGASVTVATVDVVGHTFLGWYIDGNRVSTSMTYTFIVEGDITLEAKWQKNVYSVSVSAGAGGTATASKTSVSYGDSVVLTATPSTGYVFEGWYVNGQKVAGATAQYSIAAVTGNLSYTAQFKKNNCTLTLQATSGGTVTGGGTYGYGSQVTITATATTGYEFVSWSDGVTSRTRVYTVTENTVLTATFAPKKCQVTVTADNSAAGAVSGGGTYDMGAMVALKATTNEGYEFLGWYENGTTFRSASATYYFNVSADKTFVAKWSATTVTGYTLTINSDMSGAGNTTGGGSYTSGKQATLVATANTGYSFVGWYNGSQLLSSNATYTLTVNSNMTITAKWKKNTYAISVTAGAGGTVTGGGTYEYGAQATLVATTQTGYEFLGWYDESDALIDSATSYTFTVNNARTITAKWKQAQSSMTEEAWRATQGYNYFYYEQLGADVMPIGSWCSPTPARTITVGGVSKTFSNQITLANYQTLAASGINATYGLYETGQSDITNALNYANQAGVVYLVRDNNAISNLASGGSSVLSNRYYVTAPAYGGTLLFDEPGYQKFSQIGQATAAWRGNQTYGASKLALVNNLPIYATAGQLYYGVTSTATSAPVDYHNNYEAWVRAYMETVNPQVFSYDFYPFNGVNTSVQAGYYENMSIVREVCTEYNTPFWTFAQVGNWEGTRELSQAEVAIQINTALAYGAKGVQWFNYWQPLEFSADSICSLVDHYGNKTKYYDIVKGVNAQVAAVDSVLMKSASKGIVQIGESKLGEIPASDKLSSYGAMTSAVGSGNAIVGCFEYRDMGYAYYISSNDTTAGATVSLNLNGVYDVQMIQNATTTTATSSCVTVSVGAGEGVLIVVPKAKSTKSVATVTANTENTASGKAFGTGSYAIGTKATIAACAEDGYIFDGWYNGTTKVSSAANYTFTVSGAITLTAKWKADTTPVMLNNCESVGGWMQANKTPTLSTSNVFEGSHSIEISSTSDWWWFNLRILDSGMSLDDLKAKFETITFNVYSSYASSNTLFLGNGEKAVASLTTGNNVVTINTSDLTSSSYVTDGTGYFINFFVGGGCTLRIDNVVGIRRTGSYTPSPTLINACDSASGFWCAAGATVNTNSAYIAEGSGSVKMTFTGWAPMNVYWGTDNIAQYETVTLTIYSTAAVKLLAGDINYITDPNCILAELNVGKNEVTIPVSKLKAYGLTASIVAPYVSGACTLYFDNIVAM